VAGVGETAVGHPFDHVLLGADPGDVHRHSPGPAPAQGPDPVGVRGGQQLLGLIGVDVADLAPEELEGLPLGRLLPNAGCAHRSTGCSCG
jgi:hypothetical protein